jgi:lipid-A-disaccharide synthase
VLVDDNASLLTAADLVLVASGTATLEVAYYRKPMIVVYDAGRLFGIGHRAIGRWLVHTPHLSLVNILAGRRVVPEFMPSVRSAEAVARLAADLLGDESWRAFMVRQIDETVRGLEGSRASERVLELIGEAAT